MTPDEAPDVLVRNVETPPRYYGPGGSVSTDDAGRVFAAWLTLGRTRTGRPVVSLRWDVGTEADHRRAVDALRSIEVEAKTLRVLLGAAPVASLHEDTP